MNCRRVRHLLLDFVDGLGNEALHAEVERHLAQCAECETFAAETTRSLALLRRAPVEPLDENFNWKVRLAIHREQKAGARRAASAGAWVRAWNFRYVASTGVAFALVLGAGVVVMERGAPTSPAMEPATRTVPVRPAPREVAEDRSVRPTRPGVVRGAAEQLVTVGGSEPATVSPSARGAIDPYAEEVAIDSLIDARLHQFSPEMRMRVIQRQIHRLQSQLEAQRAPVPQP